jgi:hypothetical protein
MRSYRASSPRGTSPDGGTGASDATGGTLVSVASGEGASDVAADGIGGSAGLGGARGLARGAECRRWATEADVIVVGAGTATSLEGSAGGGGAVAVAWVSTTLGTAGELCALTVVSAALRVDATNAAIAVASVNSMTAAVNRDRLAGPSSARRGSG